MPDRIGLNVLYLVPGQVGGSEVFARRLIDALARVRPDAELVVFAGDEAAPSLRAERWPDNVRVHRIPVKATVKPLRILAEQTLLLGAAKRAKVDVLHSLGTTAPLAGPRPRIVTILDLIYEHFPATFPPAARAGLKAIVGPGARASDRVIAISHAVKRDIVERLGVDAGKVDVVHLGFGMRAAADPTPKAELRARLGLGDRRVILCVSAALAHKNLPRLIEAFARLEQTDTHLVLAGHAGREHDALTRLARDHGLEHRVTLTGWISDEDLEGLYALATCCAYPSLHEGFGLPVLEAMARGVPLASSNATSLPEVAGDAAELFDPHDLDAIAAALDRLLADPARAAELVAKGRERVEDFTWERSALQTWAVYDRVRGRG